MVPALPQCKMNETKLEVSENYEEAELSDVDDDVFVRGGGRNGYRLEYDTAKKPLMAPRKKQHNFDGIKNGGFHTEVRSSPPVLKVICIPMCYILIATMAMLGIIALALFIAGHVRWPIGISRLWAKGKLMEKVIPCDNIIVEDVWVRHFPKLLTESSFRTLDVNQDGVDDIIFGYATGVDGLDVPDFVCDIYFPGQNPCFGGVLALSGKDGSELWRHWTKHEVFALNCNEDVNQDGQRDCLIAGRAGVFCAIDTKTGKELWTFESDFAKNSIMNVYTPQFVRDLNGDNVPDIVAIHGGDPLAEAGNPNRLAGKIMVIDGKNGAVLQWMQTPDNKESYYSPQIVTKDQDGSEYVLFGTGGETNGGGLYVIQLSDLYKGLPDKAQAIYKDETKGIMVPPVITDVNDDGVDDIVMAMFNSSVVAFDGSNYKQIWNYTFPVSETYTTPTPGYFNDDDTPDFLVKYQTGPGFPVYYSAETTILDGRTGKPILNESIIDSIGTQASTPVIRVEGLGNDIFLYWSSNCKGYEGNNSAFSFVKGTNVHEKSRSDFCKLRFDSKLINHLRAISRKVNLPGTILYDSDVRSESEYNMSIDTSQEGQNYLQSHPQMWKYFGQQSQEKDAIPPAKDTVPMQDNPFDKILPQVPVADIPGLQYQDLNSPQFLPQVPQYSQRYGSDAYDMSAQAESIRDEAKYPSYHSVRKHGNNLPPLENIPLSDLESNIRLNRRRFEGQSETRDQIIEQIQERLQPLQTYGNIQGAPQGPLQESVGGGYEQYGQLQAWRRNQGLNDLPSNQGKRKRRHVGPHDNEGIQRLISTGAITNPLGANRTGIDLVFATYWFYPAKTKIVPSKDCEEKKFTKRGSTRRKAGVDKDKFSDCEGDDGSEDDGTIYESQTTYNPFDLHMGQMTVYRLHIDCRCEKYKPNGLHERCARILPFKDQTWAGYMGSHADSYFPKIDVRKEILRFLQS